jgi:TNF receptor-associated protein 1
MSEPQTHTFQAEIQQLLDIVIHSVYTDKEVFVRELISNAADACEKFRFRQSGGESPVLDPDVEPLIAVALDEEANTVTITDTGIGMTEADLAANLGTIAHSGTKAFFQQLAEQKKAGSNLIGQFGVGFYSAFMVADRVTVESRSSEPEEGGHKWESQGAAGYTIEPAADLPRGTRITLHLKEDAKEFAKEHRIETVIKRYSNFVQFPIRLNDKQVNTVQALWTRNKSEITDEEYKEFYQFVGHDFDEPQYRLHYSVDAPLAIQALLFVPKRNMESMGFGKSDPEVNLYCRKVLIEPKAKGLLPEWLRFVRGVVDSEDLPLSISRERMQDSALMEKLKSVITKRFLKYLAEEAEKDAEKYAAFYKEFHRFLKEGLLTDYANQDTIAKLLRFDSSFAEKGKTTSLDDYIARMKDDQKEIYYLTTYNRESGESAPYYEVFRSRGYEVLFLYDPADEFVMERLADYNEKKLVSAEKADLKLEDEQTEGLSEEQSKELTGWIKTRLDQSVDEVRTSNRLVDSPVVLLAKDKEMTATMRQMMRNLGRDGDLPPMPMDLEINPRHPVIVKLNELRATDEGLAGQVTEQLLDNALIMAGLMEDPRAMVKRLNSLLGSVLEAKR